MPEAFVSCPDTFNADIGDVRNQLTWNHGDPNSMNPWWSRGIDVCFDAVEFENPRAVWVAGDLVEGHWEVDTDDDQMFGPVGTDVQKLAAIDKAADCYYSYWKYLWDQRNLPVFPAIGDHEILDDRLASQPVDERWPSTPGAAGFRWRAIPACKAKFAEHFPMSGCAHPPPNSAATGTAYAKEFANTLLVSVDMFTRHDDGVRLGVESHQLSWLDDVLLNNTLPNVIVQGHVPVLMPVRKKHSGGLHVTAGDASPFWQCLRDNNVPLFLAGEVHDITAIAPPGDPVQISHGSLFHKGFNYLRITPADNGVITIQSKAVTLLESDDAGPNLWGCDATKRPNAHIVYERPDPAEGPPVIGTMTIDNGVVTERSGSLDVATDLGHTY